MDENSEDMKLDEIYLSTSVQPSDLKWWNSKLLWKMKSDKQQ